MMRTFTFVAALLATGAAAAQTPVMPASKGVFTAAQAAKGAALFSQNCARCHGAGMSGQDVNPPLIGAAFLANWINKPIADLAKRIRTSMPLDAPGSLGLADTADLVAALLQANGYLAGANALPASPAAQAQIVLDAAPHS